LHRLFALEALLGGVTPWPASVETFELLPLLKPLGGLEEYRFADWRNEAVTLSDRRCASAIYSRPGEAYVLLAQSGCGDERGYPCVLHPGKLPHPLNRVTAAMKLAPAGDSLNLDVRQWVGEGIRITLPSDDAMIIRVR